MIHWTKRVSRAAILVAACLSSQALAETACWQVYLDGVEIGSTCTGQDWNAWFGELGIDCGEILGSSPNSTRIDVNTGAGSSFHSGDAGISTSMASWTAAPAT